MSAYLLTMETAVSFIEAHLQEEITLADMAASVSYSVYHFCRIFNQIVQHPPHDYLVRRRLTEAAKQLNDNQQSVTDVSFAYQFGSPETFSRAFRRLFGELPSQWRKRPFHDPRVLMQPLTIKDLAFRNESQFKRPTLVEMEACTLAGLMTIVPQKEAAETAVSQLQQQLPLASHTCFHYPDQWTTQGIPLFVGRAQDTCAAPPFVTQTIPAHAYACFHLPMLPEERPLLTTYIYQTWLPQSAYQLAASFELELDHHLYIPIKPQ